MKMALLISFSFFFHQMMRNWFIGNYQKGAEKIIKHLSRRHKKQNVGSKWTPLPLTHLSVKLLLISDWWIGGQDQSLQCPHVSHGHLQLLLTVNLNCYLFLTDGWMRLKHPVPLTTSLADGKIRFSLGSDWWLYEIKTSSTPMDHTACYKSCWWWV